MGMLLVLLMNREAIALGAESAEGLASLGVTRLAVLRDGEGVALAMEGWAFDPVRLAKAAFEIVAPGTVVSRTLYQVAEVGVAQGAIIEESWPDQSARQAHPRKGVRLA